jgi:transcriptional regulator
VYIPEPFNVADKGELAALMRAQPFATLISAGRSGLNATHLPTVLKAEGEQPTELNVTSHVPIPSGKSFPVDATR